MERRGRKDDSEEKLLSSCRIKFLKFIRAVGMAKEDFEGAFVHKDECRMMKDEFSSQFNNMTF